MDENLLPNAQEIAERLGRTLDEPEGKLVAVLAADALRLIKAKIPSFAERVASGLLDPESVKMVIANAIVRVLKNPDGYRSESMGGMSYTIDTRAAAGFLTILGEEWSFLGVGQATGFIAPETDGYAEARFGVRPDLWFQWGWPAYNDLSERWV